MKKLAGFILGIFPRPLLIKASLHLIPLLDIVFRGDKRTDPINGKRYRCFLPYGYGRQRPNALSPGTFSLERHRQLWLYLQRETSFFRENHSVLHIAPEQCFFRRFKKLPNLKYISSDLYSPIVDVKADICALPFEDESFDVVLCNHVLEHIPDDKTAMKELFRVMKKGGFGVVQVPIKNTLTQTFEDPSITDPKERQKFFGQYDHVRQYGLDFKDRLEAAGFRVEMLFYSQEFSRAEQERFGLMPNEILPIIYKD